MVKVITYGTYDLLHHGHIKLLERAKALGDYLIVGVTSDDYDKTRGKINNQQSLMDRVAAVKALGIADMVIAEEYEGQKIDDIRRYGIDIFTVGSDWEGKFDYLNEYCKVVYLPRTEGISSSEIRAEKRKLQVKIIGESVISNKFERESEFVNGVEIIPGRVRTTNEEGALDEGEAVYLITPPERHAVDVENALKAGKHVLCESPIAFSQEECQALYALADEKKCTLIDGIKTAYSTAYSRLILMAKGGRIGKILSVDVTCTSMQYSKESSSGQWRSICSWGPTALLPVFQLLGTEYTSKRATSWMTDNDYDGFTKIEFNYPNAVATVKVAKNAKSEGELIITGSKGYIYVPAPWWKTDYFEVRYEESTNNRRFFYQLDGEGIRYEIVSFAQAIQEDGKNWHVSRQVSSAISKVIGDCCKGTDCTYIK